MRKILIILLVAFATTTMAQQNKNCNTAISTYEFQKQKSLITAVRNEAQKLSKTKRFCISNCLSSAQVIEIISIFSSEYSKLDVATAAYTNVVDKGNFYEVYNSFKQFSTVFRLYDFVNAHKVEENNQNKNNHQNENNNPNENENNNNEPHQVEIVFPSYIYPRSFSYRGNSGCEVQLSDPTFLQLVKPIANVKEENKRLNEISELVKGNCFTTAQLMKLSSLLSFDRNKLTLSKDVYHYIYDLDNYRSVMQIFASESYKQEFQTFLYRQQNNNSYTGETSSCEVTDSEMTSIYITIKNAVYEDSKLTTAKRVIKAKECFLVSQIVELMELFSMDDSKLDFVKYAYDYTKDESNYYLIANEFKFSSSKSDFNNFLKTKEQSR